MRFYKSHEVRDASKTLADKHLRGCYGVTGEMGRARELAMRRAPGLNDIEGGRCRPEGASCEHSDLGSDRRLSDCCWTFGLIIA
ncbi:jg1590 [Pararge aegeria aegeria]|uniref:Jg1590 protein n=1 Tax=Pararge aegeria aegeria TaxID=348720 RepID=A0A8S4RXA6_9NEOP|nr:jg1590 [Pararge aegeria aegeria]